MYELIWQVYSAVRNFVSFELEHKLKIKQNYIGLPFIMIFELEDGQIGEH